MKVLVDASAPPDSAPAPKRLLQAIWYVVFADLTMSTDNILAIAGASKGSFGLIVFGLCVSIPFVVFASNLLADLMDRYPATIYLGGAILGQVGGEMILTDPFVVGILHPTDTLRYAVEGVLIVVVLVAGRLLTGALLRDLDHHHAVRRHFGGVFVGHLAAVGVRPQVPDLVRALHADVAPLGRHLGGGVAAVE